MPEPTSLFARRSLLKAGAFLAGAGLAGLQARPAASAGKTEALLLTCMDFRLMDDVARYMERRGLAERYDHVILAGASLGAFTEKYPAWAQTFWSHLRLSRELHHVARLIVLDHRDCGAYNALLGPEHARTPTVELETHGAHLRRLRAEALKREPGLEVETLLMALDGAVEAVV